MSNGLKSIGTCSLGDAVFERGEILTAIPRIREPVLVVREGPGGRLGLAPTGTVGQGAQCAVLATLPAMYPEWLGDRSFNEVHGTRFPYVAGAMANGISTAEMVVAMARAGMIGFFGAGGLEPKQVEAGLEAISARLGADAERLPWGSNLIFSPGEPNLELAVVDLYLQRGVRRVSASAYMQLTPAVVRYAASGLSVDASGQIQRRNHVFAKVSREEVARLFLSPAPTEILDALVTQGGLSREEANLAVRVPLAEDITVEADSGGHTDNRALSVLLPTLSTLRDELCARHQYQRPVRVGAAGGLGTPSAVAAAFAAGAAYVLTGTVNQAAVESGLSSAGKALLAEAGIADVTMAPSPDMFELGVQVQVLQRGTLFASRAKKLYQLYSSFDDLESMPAGDRERLENEVFQMPLDRVWDQTRAFFEARNPAEIVRAEREPRHQMALVFRWYLGKSSHWAIDGERDRRMDYQIWCGPAIGAFNKWVAGTFLAEPENRVVDQIARNLLEGAAVVTRAHQLRCYGVPVPSAAYDYRPRPLR